MKSIRKYKQRIQTKLSGDGFQKMILPFLCIFALSYLVMITTFFNTTAVFNKEFFDSYFRDFHLIIYNFFPIFLIMLLISIASKKVWVGFGITAYLFYILSLVNKFKLRFRDDPFVFSDFKLINEARDMSGKYDLSLSMNQILILCLIFIGILLCRKFIKDIELSRRSRGIVSLELIVSFALFLNFCIFNPIPYDTLGDTSLINVWSKSQQYQIKGFTYPFLYSLQGLKKHVPENYDPQQAKDILYAYEYEDIPEDKQVNVISIMLESFNDLGKFEGVEFEHDVYSKFYELQSKSISGDLVTNIFAGGTVDTERGFLNGYQNHPEYLKKTNSFVHYFNQQGYYTEAMHPCYGWFYNRRNINTGLGFQNFYYVENYFEEIVMDEVVFSEIIRGYENSLANGTPYFNFTVTYQGHGPYSTEKLGDVDYLKWQDWYNEADYNNINNYLNSIASTVQEIDRLIMYFEQQEEPVVVVLFGDHNPLLNEDSTGFDMLGVNMDLDDEDGFINYFETPYLIWGNDAAKSTLETDLIGKGAEISPNLLMNELFQNLGYVGNEYMQYLSDVREKMDVFNEIQMKFEEEWVREPSTSQQAVLDEFINTEYYYSNNYWD